MAYRTLRSIFHQLGQAEANRVHQQRLQDSSSLILPIDLNGSPCFVFADDEMNDRIDSIEQKCQTLENLVTRLPDPAAFWKDALLDEIAASSRIECISLSHDRLENLLDDSLSDGRSAGSIRFYRKLLENDPPEFPKTILNLRNLYDQMLLDDILHEDPTLRPEGLYFRAGPVFVHDGLRTRHAAVKSEEEIIDLLEHSLMMMRNEKIPALVRIACFHFLFGYVHPFYDGNGRLNRALCSLALCHDPGLPAAICLSQAFLDQKSRYYKAFETCEDPMNQADLIPFVLFFLRALEQKMDEMIANLTAQEAVRKAC